MNIQQAKTEIIHTFRAYTKRDEAGRHRIPPEKQRPVLLIGPPGIGKTAIMGQIAEETGCALVAYYMTHHTRQSAIGLPFISHRDYGGTERAVTEYTMSEIVAAVYDAMERTGKRSGILFLDEINCVSETLSPVILQLLQNKTFGNVPLPEDWLIVAAGNPPEYNKSVRELDMVTLDRVKHIEVEADLAAWRRYALGRGLHPAVMTYLSVYPDHFYNITDTDRGQLFVTARGWEDLSLMLSAYEEDGVAVDGDWFLQYLQHDGIARSFSLYYDLFRAFSDGADESAPLADRLLAAPDKLAQCPATQCLALAAMLFHGIELEAGRLALSRKRLERRRELAAILPPEDAFALEEGARAFFARQWEALEIKASHGALKPGEEFRERDVLAGLERDAVAWRLLPGDGRGSFAAYERELIEKDAAADDAAARQVSGDVERAYRVLEACPQGRSALLYLASDLSASVPCSEVLKRWPSDRHARYAAELEG